MGVRARRIAFVSDGGTAATLAVVIGADLVAVGPTIVVVGRILGRRTIVAPAAVASVAVSSGSIVVL